MSVMDIHVTQDGPGHYRLTLAGFAMRCAVGRSGIASGKREGDGVSPRGRFPLRRLWYRADRLPKPDTRLPARAIAPDDLWCDAPGDPNYNRPVKAPYGASHETMWREDGLYDLVVELGYNDDPVVPGKGSAIFLHLCRSDYGATAGCIAVPLEEMIKLLALAGPETSITIG